MHIINSSGPSQTYPQRAYRNPLDRLVTFLDSKHGDDWAIWEFRAEGTGYPDEAVYGRVRHYPWPDHHPPPFRLIPLIMASMRNWLHGGELHDHAPAIDAAKDIDAMSGLGKTIVDGEKEKEEKKKNRVVVVHCKAGKGRSGTASCSYLISEEGWSAEDALARFTQRRMRPQFGAGVSIPSQLRWISYVSRWTDGGKKYRDRPAEVMEIHFWGLRNGVKVEVAGFGDEGKRIDTKHTFGRDERVIVEGSPPEGGGISDMIWELAGYSVSKDKAPEEADLSEGANNNLNKNEKSEKDKNKRLSTAQSLKKRGTELMRKASTANPARKPRPKTTTFSEAGPSTRPSAASRRRSPSSVSSVSDSDSDYKSDEEEDEPGGRTVVLRPKQPIKIPNADIKIMTELRNRTSKSMGFTMVTAVAHVWFNIFFEGQGPERPEGPEETGVFSIDWEAMDGLKGSSRKGGRAFDKMSVMWRVARGDEDPPSEEVSEPDESKPVPQTKAANWKGAAEGGEDIEPALGLRTKSPASADISQASSIKSVDWVAKKKHQRDDDGDSISGVRTSGPEGDVLKDDEKPVSGK